MAQKTHTGPLFKVTSVRTYDRRNQGAQRRIYFWLSGESIVENLRKRRFRPRREYRKLLGLVFERLGEEAIGEINWSQKAGCSCGCSPGFIARGDFRNEVHVDIEAA